MENRRNAIVHRDSSVAVQRDGSARVRASARWC
jgi:hypothetical protein